MPTAIPPPVSEALDDLKATEEVAQSTNRKAIEAKFLLDEKKAKLAAAVKAEVANRFVSLSAFHRRVADAAGLSPITVRNALDETHHGPTLMRCVETLVEEPELAQQAEAA